jgi:tetratricopeptide (TPR) repeat protein
LLKYIVGADAPSAPDRLRRNGLSPAQLARLRTTFAALVDALCFLHRAGVVHRDIKPSNVLVNKEGRVVVLDFGLAAELHQAAGPKHTVYNIVGTAAYMSPEQAAGMPVSAAADWYSLGAVLYEALTGRHPFSGHAHLLAEKQQHDPPEPQEFVSEVPDDLNALCMDLLRRDGSARPEGEEIRTRLGCGAPAAPMAVERGGSVRLFVGRDAQRAELADALTAVELGRTVVSFVCGESGIGKTALVNSFLEETAKRPDVVVLQGRCHEHESVPFKAIDRIIDGLTQYLVHLPPRQREGLLPSDISALWRVFPVMRRLAALTTGAEDDNQTSDRQELRRRAMAALRELLCRLGKRVLLVLFIDDLQWGDLDSGAVIKDLLRPPDSPFLLLIASYRQEEEASSAVLRAVREETIVTSRIRDVRHIEVGRLSLDESRRLARSLVEEDPALDAQWLDTIARESGGNPYLIASMVRCYQTRPVAEIDGRLSVDSMIWSQVAGLPAEAQRLLEVVALAGHPLREVDALAAAEISAHGRGAVALLRAARMVRSPGGGADSQIEVYHDRIRAAAEAHVPPARTAECHRRLARTLAASGIADPATLADHHLAAGEQDVAGQCFHRAADAAAEALAFDRAAELYQLTLQYEPLTTSERPALHYCLADALANAGRSVEAAEHFILAAEGRAPDETIELLRRASMEYLTGGKLDEGTQALRRLLSMASVAWPHSSRQALWSIAVHRVGQRLAGPLLRRAWRKALSTGSGKSAAAAQCMLRKIDLCWSASVGLSTLDPIRAADFQARSTWLAMRHPDPYRLARALATEAIFSAAMSRGGRRRVERLLEDSRALAQRSDEPHVLALVSAATGISGYMAGNWQQAVEHCDRAERMFRQRFSGTAWEGGGAQSFAASKMFWLDAVQGFSLLALYWSGEIAELDRRMPSAMAEAERHGNLHMWVRLGMLQLPLVAADRPLEAAEQLNRCAERWPQPVSGILLFYQWFGRVQINLYRGDTDAAWRLIREQWPHFEHSQIFRFRLLRVFAHHARARAALASASAGAGAHDFLQSAQRDANRLFGEDPHLARPLALIVRAGIAAHGGDSNRAAILLQDAASRFAQAHMPLLAACTKRRLAELLGGNTGDALMAESDAWMAAQGVHNPERFTALWLPGW